MSTIKLLISFITGLQFMLYPASFEQPEMKVHFIDVGQGDSIVIQTPLGKNILIDGGPPEAGKKIVDYLKALQIEKLDLVIVTHPDIDHIGGLSHVMKSIQVDEIIDSGKTHSTRTYARYINQIRTQAIPFTIAKLNQAITIDQAIDMRILNTSEKGKSNNQSSIVLKINYMDVTFLFMGDAEYEQEIDLINGFNIKADIIKVGHHGSKTGTSYEFLKKVNPKIALLTYGKDNDYGHPVDHVIDNLNKLNVQIYSTGVYGNVVIQTDGKGYYIIPEKSPADGLAS